MHGFVGRQDVAHQVGQGGDADHLIGAHVVGLAGAAVLQQGEEPMGQVAVVEVVAQWRAVAGAGDGTSNAVGCAKFVDRADLGYRKLIKSKLLEKPRFRMNEKEISFDSFFCN